ncbi:hypothetical protein BaRGS_00012105 [Batillaria attramentaria]|uniref:Uncharacterized protein n=1 Tax=Batillaria attramentaria TaxID=370345 RepID=A0ABD0LBU5_9CAEN
METEVLTDDKVYALEWRNVPADLWTWEGSVEMTITGIAGAGDLVQSALHVLLVNADNITCSTSVGSEYFYLTPPVVWLSGVPVSPDPVPMMGHYQASLNIALDHPTRIGKSRMKIQTPSEESSMEVVLTIQSMSAPQMTGFTQQTLTDMQAVFADYSSTFGSFQQDVGRVALPPLHRDVANASQAELDLKFWTRAEDYSQLHDGDVVTVTAGLQFGHGGAGDAEGGALIWVGAVSVTLEAPPPEEKRPVLNLSLSQKASCAYDGETRASVEVRFTHAPNSTATAYNLTARVYLTDAMNVTRHGNSELRQNSLSVTQRSNVIYLDVSLARMTFSDPTHVTLDLDIDMSDPRVSRAEHYVITAEACYSDRWGNSTDMYTDMEFVSLRLYKKCSTRLTWKSSDGCTCTHDPSRSDCACCVPGACQCGAVNPSLCLPCDALDQCQPYLDGFEFITELPSGSGPDMYVCDAHHRYKPWTSGVSCYRKYQTGAEWRWSGS